MRQSKRDAGGDEKQQFLIFLKPILKIVNSKKKHAAAKIDAREDEQLLSFFTWPKTSS